MSWEKFVSAIKRQHSRCNGSLIEYDLTPYVEILHEIKTVQKTFKNKSDLQLREISKQNIQLVRQSGLSETHLIEAFALVSEGIWRVLKLKAFDVQIMAAVALHREKIVEMQTGEGKTLTAVFPAYLNALTGNGVHVLTFNDYLACRDAGWMGPVYTFLGLSFGCVREGMTTRERQKMYRADITYLTAKEAGFDALRDGLCTQISQQVVQRPRHFAIVDEADSILIDEARIPLVIAATGDEPIPDTYRTAELVHNLKSGVDFEFDDYARDIDLTETGVKNIESALRCGNLYAYENIETLTQINCALHAEHLLQLDVDYIVRAGEIELVDEFTGRVAEKRRWPDGLQAALEAKEKLTIRKQGHILNSITLQHFIQFYPKLSGMTATAVSAEAEFRNFYDLGIAVIPPNRPCIRIDHEDMIFKTKAEKERALTDEIAMIHESGRPVLVGTASVEESANLTKSLLDRGLKCEVLNAKNDAREAEIISRAGRLGAITISTNMAGRGTDICLGTDSKSERKRILDLDGLYVIGTNKHESRRIDQQLRGRSGRQGDPGSSRFFISLEDDLFIKYKLSELLPKAFAENNADGEIDSHILRNEINRTQRIVEGQNLEIKKTLCRYSSLLEKQRIIVFEKRNRALQDELAVDLFRGLAPEKFKLYQGQIGAKNLKDRCKKIFLAILDKAWATYLAEIAEIREGIHLHRLGGQVPFFEFQKVAVQRFDKLLETLGEDALTIFNNFEAEGDKLNAPSATWTYLVNDNPFENMLGFLQPGNTKINIDPVTGLFILAILLLNKIGKNKKS